MHENHLENRLKYTPWGPIYRVSDWVVVLLIYCRITKSPKMKGLKQQTLIFQFLWVIRAQLGWVLWPKIFHKIPTKMSGGCCYFNLTGEDPIPRSLSWLLETSGLCWLLTWDTSSLPHEPPKKAVFNMAVAFPHSKWMRECIQDCRQVFL